MDVEISKPEESTKTIPSKYVSDDIILKLRWMVYYIDYEGRVDEESIRNIIQQLSPRKIVLKYLILGLCTRKH